VAKVISFPLKLFVEGSTLMRRQLLSPTNRMLIGKECTFRMRNKIREVLTMSFSFCEVLYLPMDGRLFEKM
jgi:hypothetical protein